jgi:hypothetical protein
MEKLSPFAKVSFFSTHLVDVCLENSSVFLMRTGRMLRHGNGPGRQALERSALREHPARDSTPFSFCLPFAGERKRVKESPRGVRVTRVTVLAGSLVPVVRQFLGCPKMALLPVFGSLAHFVVCDGVA